MKTIFKLICIIGLVLLFENLFGADADTLTIVKVVAVDTNASGMTNAVEVEFNQPVKDDDFNGDLDDFFVSNFSSFSPQFECDVFSTKVEYIANSDAANDKYIRLGFTNDRLGGDLYDNTDSSIYLKYYKTPPGGNITAYYNSSKYLRDTTMVSPAIDMAGPVVEVISFDPSSGTVGIGSLITVTFEVSDTITYTDASIFINNKNALPITAVSNKEFEVTYTVNDGDDDIAELDSIPVYISLLDTGLNRGPEYRNSPPASTPGIDAHKPEIVSVTFIPENGTLAIGDSVKVRIQVADTSDNALSADTISVNSVDVKSTLDILGKGNYEVYYKVESGDFTVDDGVALPIRIVLTDGVNKCDTFKTTYASNTPGVYAVKPVISGSVNVEETGTVTSLVGDSIKFTVNVTTPDADLTISPSTFNGRNLNWITEDLGSSYKGVYVVTEGDQDRDADYDLTNVTLTDQAGNVSDPKIGDITFPIDANTPKILSVTSNAITADTYVDGDQIKFTVDIKTAEKPLTILPAQYNNRNLNWTADATGDIYTGTYNVTEGDADRNIPLQLTGVTAEDAAGNISNVVNGSDVVVTIDAHTPVVNDVSVSESRSGTVIVGDNITFTIDVDSADATLVVDPVDYNGELLNWFTNDGGDTYIGIYNVTEGNQNRTLDFDLENVTVADPAGNISSPAKVGDISVNIDANSPKIDSVKLLNVPKKVNDIDTLIVYIENDPNSSNYTLISGAEVAGFGFNPVVYAYPDSLYLTFTVTETMSDILPDDDIEVSGLQLKDLAGNISNIKDTTISQSNDPIYTVLPTAKVSGSKTVCHRETVDLVFQLTGSAPWKVTVDSCSTLVTVENIMSSPYIYTVNTDNPLGGTDIYKITQVTDAHGNVKNISSPESFSITINKLPDVSFTNHTLTYNVSADPDTLKGGAPDGGVYSGPGIVPSNSTFSPESAGVGGPYEIVYTYTNTTTGCSNSASLDFTVVESDAYFFFYDEEDQWQCDYDTSFVVYGGVLNKPINGDIVFHEKPTAISKIDGKTDSVKVDIQGLSAGTHTLYYVYNDAILDSVPLNFTVESVSDSYSLTTIPDHCANYDTIFVEAYNFSPLGGVGTFMFSGDEDHYKVNASDTNKIYFYPDSLAPGDYTLDYYYTSPNGCYSDTTQRTFAINSLPDVSFAPGTENTFNIDQGEITIIGSPADAGGEFSSTLEFIDDNKDGTAIIDPNENDLGSRIIIYTYTNANSCVEDDTLNITVNKADGTIESSSGKFQFCYYGSSPVTFTGTPVPTDNSPGTFYIDDNPITTVDNQMVFNPQDYTAGTHQLVFKYKNNTTPYEVYEEIDIDSIGEIYFTGLNESYCTNIDEEHLLTASTPTGDVGQVTFSGTGVNLDGNAWSFNSFELKGDQTITYTYERDYSGCTREVSKTTTVYNAPRVAFYPNEICMAVDEDQLGFSAESFPSDSVVKWTWTVLGSSTPYIGPDPIFTIDAPEFITMNLKLDSKYGCTNDVDSIFYIGTKAGVNFSFANECYGEYVEFKLELGNDPDDIDSIKWNFGGAGDSDISDPTNPFHRYAQSGAYEIIYEEYLKSCGRDADTAWITVRPSIDLSDGDYFESFEDHPDITGWVIEDYDDGEGTVYNNSWQWGEPEGVFINDAASGNNAFVTNLTGNYTSEEQGMVTSPCFDFSGLERPMIKLDITEDISDGSDGAVIQYFDGVWTTLGVPGDGVNWINSSLIGAKPGGNPYGWTENTFGWETAMYRLDQLSGRAGVRLRIVFGSNGDSESEGFGFDNIWLGERKRTVLIENFTNITDDNAINKLEEVHNNIQKDSLDVITLNYHTGFPGANELNSFYPSGPSARALYYGVSSVPYSIVDGGNRQFDYTFNELTEADIHKQILMDPLFNINVQQDVQDNNFIVSANLKALDEMTGYSMNVYVAVVEKTIVYEDEVYHNVLRTMLPDAAGVLVERDWLVNDSVNIYQTWSLPENVTPDSLVTIVFIQDEDSKDIYQTAYTNEYNTITSINDGPENYSVAFFEVYPNPVNDILTLKLNQLLSSDSEVKIYNGVGETVIVDKVLQGNNILKINTQNLPSGVYYIKMNENDNAQVVRRFIKTK